MRFQSGFISAADALEIVAWMVAGLLLIMCAAWVTDTFKRW